MKENGGKDNELKFPGKFNPREPEENEINPPSLGVDGDRESSAKFELMTKELKPLVEKVDPVEKEKKLRHYEISISAYTDDKIRDLVKKSTREDWAKDPIFYLAVLAEIKHRKLFL